MAMALNELMWLQWYIKLNFSSTMCHFHLLSSLPLGTKKHIQHHSTPPAETSSVGVLKRRVKLSGVGDCKQQGYKCPITTCRGSSCLVPVGGLEKPIPAPRCSCWPRYLFFLVSKNGVLLKMATWWLAWAATLRRLCYPPTLTTNQPSIDWF